MTPDEKEKLLTLFAQENRWCRGCEARDGVGDPVCYDDKAAVAWDLVGGICHLFGWTRGRELFGQIHRHIGGRPGPRRGQDEAMAAMAALFDFNDSLDTTYDKVMATLQEMPVWRGKLSQTEPAPFTADLPENSACSE
jgi:hypothetical protein